MKYIRYSLYLLVCLAALVQINLAYTKVALAETYYISPNGNDSNSGLATTQPWRTFDRAWDGLFPGDTLLLMDGTYNQTLNPNERNGLPNNPITVKALNDGMAVIDGQGVRDTVILENWSHGPIGSYFVIEGIVARNSSSSVFQINFDNNTLRRVSGYDANTDNNEHVFTITGSNTLVEDCVAAGTGRKMIVVFQGSNNVIRRCFANWQSWAGRNWHDAWPWGDNIQIYNANDNIIENSIAYGPAPVWSISVQANSEEAEASNNQLLGSMAINAGMNNDGTVKQWGTTRPGPTEHDSLRDFGWPSQRVGIMLLSAGTFRNNLVQDVVAYGNAGLGFSTLIYGPRTRNNRLVRATIKNNGLNNPDNYGGIGAEVILDELSQLSVTETLIEGSTVHQGRGAIIKNRYVNGTLTNTPLWPWPMQSRIQNEMGFSIHALAAEVLGDPTILEATPAPATPTPEMPVPTTPVSTTPAPATPTPATPTQVTTPSATPLPGTGGRSILYLSSSTDGSIGGIPFRDEDVLAYDLVNSQWQMIFDGSDVGVHSDVNAVAILDDSSMLLSLTVAQSLSGIDGLVDDSDIIRFVPTSVGEETAGSFERYFDGSDVGLDTNGEDLYGLHVLSNGDIVVTTNGSATLPGLTARDEDLFVFTPTSLGEETAGSWRPYLDGSDIKLTDGDEDLWGVTIYEAGNIIYLSTFGVFDVTGASGDGADIFICAGSVPGAVTTCSASLFWDGSIYGFGKENVDAIALSDLLLGSISAETPKPTDESITSPIPPTPTPTPMAGNSSPVLFVSSSTNGSISDVAFNDEDILAFDLRTGQWALLFDGSDVGVQAGDVNAFTFFADEVLLLSFTNRIKLPGVGVVDDSDIVSFTATTMGADTIGTFSLFFDGSDVGLTTNGEDIHALDLLDDGRLVISTNGTATVSGASGIPGASGRTRRIIAQDEDLLLFTPTQIGADTMGSWEFYFDGSGVNMLSNQEDIWGLFIDELTGDLRLSTAGGFAMSGISGDSSDIFTCAGSTPGSATNCAFALFWDGSANEFGREVVDAIAYSSGGSARSASVRQLFEEEGVDQFDYAEEPSEVDPSDDPYEYEDEPAEINPIDPAIYTPMFVSR